MRKTVAVVAFVLLFVTYALSAWSQPAAQPGDVTMKENLILNPSFEDPLQDWQAAYAGPGADAARDDSCAASGKWSLRLRSKSGETSKILLWKGPVEPNRRYRFEIRYANSIVGTDAEVAPCPLVRIWYPNGAALYFIGSHLADDWQTLVAEFTTPKDATTLNIQLYLERKKGSLWFDDAKFGPLERNGQPLVTAPDGNLLFNGDLEQGAAGQPYGWEAGCVFRGIYGEWLAMNKAGANVWSDEQPNSGKKCLAGEVQDPQKVHDIEWQQRVALNPDTDYKLSCWVRTDGAMARASAIPLKPDFSGVDQPLCYIGNTSSPTWVQVERTFHTPAWDGKSREVHIYLSGTATRPGGKMFWDDIRLAELGEIKGLKVEITSNKPQNAFATVQDATLMAKLTNATNTPMTVSGYYSIGKPDGSFSPPRPLLPETELAAGDSKSLPLANIAKEPGQYKLRVTLKSGDNTTQVEAAFSVGG
jgi:hypothetical protein